MANRQLVPTSYKRLVSDIATLYENARKALIEAYWKIGHRIVEVEQQGEIKAAYGSGLLAKLSQDLTQKKGSGFSIESLRRMRLFYLDNPKSSPARKLTWAHHIELLSIRDKKKRLELEKRVEQEELDRDSLRALVHHEHVREQVEDNLKADPEKKEPVELLTPPKDLTLHTYQKAAIDSSKTDPAQGACVLDCGFYVYRTVTTQELKKVTVTDKPAYVYAALVERVVDGDTLVFVIDVGFGTQVREKVRLRGIDCPELGTEEGEMAKRFVAKLLPPGTEVLIRSTKSDKYGRFVADVFLSEQYLNNLLLEKGLAVRMGD